MNVGRWRLPETDSYFAPHMTEEGFQIDHLRVALKYVRAWRTAVDGGAHVGTWTCWMAQLFERVAAFEPAEDTFECLFENTRRLDNVVRLRAALGELPGMASVVDDARRPGNTGARYLAPGNDVEIVRLDDLELDDVDFIKLDLEGGELHALRGAEATLRRCKPVVCVEEKHFGGRFGVQPGAALAFLRSLGATEAEVIRNDHVWRFDDA